MVAPRHAQTTEDELRKKVRLKPKKMVEAEILPHSYEYMRPVIFGHQKCSAPKKPATAAPIMM